VAVPTFNKLNSDHLDMVRGSGKYKVKRGGGRQFTAMRDMTLDEDGVAVDKWSAYRFGSDLRLMRADRNNQVKKGKERGRR